MKLLVVLLVMAISPFAQAMDVRSCADAEVDLTTVVNPPAQNSKTFGNNAIAVFNIDTGEPAAASAGLAITLPDSQSEDGLGMKCFALTGLSAIDVMKAVATYDANKGLLLTIPGSLNVDGEHRTTVIVHLRVNQAKSTVTLE
jgi:hypothetical protein